MSSRRSLSLSGAARQTLAAALAATAVGFSPGAQGQSGGGTPAEGDAATQLVAGTWTLNCAPAGDSDALNCEASQTVAVAKTQQTVLAVFVTPRRRDGEPDGFALRFQLPHGIDIPAGVRLRIDGEAMPAPAIQTSSPAGLFARTGLTEPLLAAMRKGAAMEVDVTALTGASVTVPVTLNGFSAIFAKLQ